MSILKINSLQRVSSGSNHCAFTDLCEQFGLTLCCYREAHNHVSGDGIIVIVAINQQGEIFKQRLSSPGWDLRDPKFYPEANGKLRIIAYAKPATRETEVIGRHMMSWFTTTGHSWSSVTEFGPKNWWLWRFQNFNNKAWGIAYNRPEERIDLYSGAIGGHLERVKEGILSKAKHQLGYPNESDLYLDQNKVMWAIVRRDADSYSAQLGCAKAPYTQWQWFDLGCYIGGPVWASLSEEHMLVAGRDWDGKKTLTTAIWSLSLKTKTLTKQLTLPSGGDTSYPGLVVEGDILKMSYYSSHIDQQSRVYLAQISGLDSLKKVLETAG